MTFRGRTRVVIIACAVGLLSLAAGRALSPRLVRYVVEQAVIQKAPKGQSVEQVRILHAYLDTLPDDSARLIALLAVSQGLERVQRLDSEGLRSLLGGIP